MSYAKQAMESGFEYGAPCVEGDYPDAWAPQSSEIVAEVPQDKDLKASPPMRITNLLNLPMPLVAAVKNDKYSPGKSDYTTSQLAGTPARQFALKRIHWKELTEDVADRIYSLSGQSKHVILERAAEFCEDYEYLAEKRFYIERCGKTIGGQIDLYDIKTRTLYDWKEVSVWVATDALKNPDDLKPEWITQGNINKLLCEENGYPVERLVNIALYRDWKKSIALTKPETEYPKHQVGQFPLPIWPVEQTERFLESRITEFERSKAILPECSDEERWYRGETFALIKKGNKKATKLFDTEAEAKNHIEVFKLSGYEIKFRPGTSTRCESYCVVSEHCAQYAEIKRLAEEDKPQAA